MFKLTISSLWARKIRFALTGLAVVLGVAFMAGTFVLTDTVQRSFDHILETANSGIDVVVQDADTTGSDSYTGERVEASFINTIHGIDGVAGVAGVTSGFAQIVGSDGTVQSPDGIGGTIGMNWVDDDQLSPLVIASGRPPTADDEVALDVGSLERQDWTIGSTVTVLGRGAPTQLTVVGTVRYGDIESVPGTTLVVVNDAMAQQMFGEPGMYDAIVARATEGVSANELTSRVRNALADPEVDVLTGMEDTESQKATLHEGLAFFSTMIMAFAWIALFVGTFIIRNTFSIVVAQRQKESAMLRAIGAGRRQLMRAVLLEAALVGAVASAVGLFAGVGVAKLLKALLGLAGLEMPPGDLVIQTRTIVVSFAVGVLVTLFSAMGPAMRGSRIKPIAALRGVAIEAAGASRKRVISGVVVLGLGGALFGMGVSGDPGSAAAVGFGTLLGLVGVGILGPVIVRPAVATLGAGYRPLFGTVGQMAKENAQRNPRRTAATASALMIGVALVTFITVLAASAKSSTTARLDRTLTADYVVDSGAFEQGGFSPVLAGELASLDEVGAVSPLRSTSFRIDGTSASVAAVDTSSIDEVLDLDVQSGSLAGMHGNQIAVEAATASANGWTVGDTVTLDFTRTGEQQFTIAAILGELVPDVPGGMYVVGLDAFEANVNDQFDLRVYVSLAAGVSGTDGEDALDAALQDWPNADLQDQTEVKAAVAADIDKALNFIYGLLFLAVLIALIGIANTLGLSIHERRREVGMLRAIGMERAQVRTAVRLESVLVALLGTALGCLVALGGSWGLVTALSSTGLSEFTVPAAPMVAIVVASVAAGVLAAVWPARRAARQDMLAAIAAT